MYVLRLLNSPNKAAFSQNGFIFIRTTENLLSTQMYFDLCSRLISWYFFWCIITIELHNIEMAFALWIYAYTQALKKLHARIPSMNYTCACGFSTLHNAWRGSRINTLPKTIYWSKLMNSSCYHSLWLFFIFRLLFLHLGCFLFPQRSLFFFLQPPQAINVSTGRIHHFKVIP